MITPQQEALWAADITRRCLEASPDDVDAALEAAEYIVAQGPTPEDIALTTDAQGREHKGKGKGGGQFVSKKNKNWPDPIQPRDNMGRLGPGGVASTKEFKRWFKGSQVVTDTGEPLAVYHGTKEEKEFDQFDADRTNLSPRGDSSALGFFFTPDEEGTRTYSSKSGHVVVAYLNIKNPAYLTEEEYREATNSRQSARKLRERLISEGHDGIYADHLNEWIAFQPDQIRKVGTKRQGQKDISFSLDAYLSHDIANPKAQGLLTATLKKADAFAQDAMKSLESALDKEGADSGQAILAFVNEYHAKLADLLTEAQLSAALEGALEVADKVPQLDADAEAIARIYGHIPRPAFSTDAQGHEHKGKGKGGGQFVSKGKGGDDGDKSKTTKPKSVTTPSKIEKIPKKFLPPNFKGRYPENVPNKKLSRGSRPILDDEEQLAIRKYTDDLVPNHRFLNKLLREGKPLPKNLRDIHEYLQTAFGKIEELDKPVNVRRGMDLVGSKLKLFRKLVEGAITKKQTIQLRGYTSTTTKKKPSDDFNHNIDVHILARKGLDVKPYSLIPWEDELLINHDSKFKPLHIEMSGGKLHIYKEQIE